MTNDPVFTTIRAFANTADMTDLAALTSLVSVLPGVTFTTAAVDTAAGETGRPLVRVTMRSPIEGEPPKERWFDPTYAAIVRVLETAGGTVSLLRRSPTQKQFGLMLNIGPVSTTLSRILLGITGGGRVVERQDFGGDRAYRFFVPSNYAFQPSDDRSDVLRVVRKQAGADVADLLRDLFALADVQRK